jgi:hypothetical protein
MAQIPLILVGAKNRSFHEGSKVGTQLSECKITRHQRRRAFSIDHPYALASTAKCRRHVPHRVWKIAACQRSERQCDLCTIVIARLCEPRVVAGLMVS